MEMASTLDRSAQSSPTVEDRRARWKRAIEVLERFRLQNPGHPLRRVFEVQGAVYHWALARSRVLPERVAEADDQSRALAVADLKNSLDRLLPAVSSYGTSSDLPAQNARYRLSQTIADLAIVGSDDPKERRARNEEALAALTKPFGDPALQGYASLLKAQLLLRLDRPNEAGLALEASVKANPAPSEREILDTRIDLLLALNRVEEALRAIDGSTLDAPSKLARRVKVGLHDREAKLAGPQRAEAESALFRDLKALRQAGGPESKTWLIAAAKAIPAPGPEQSPDAWDLLADGAVAQGNPDRAGDLASQGAARAAEVKDPKLESQLRLKAGAAWFQSGRFQEADKALVAVAQDSNAGALRARAAMLSALARGRALATNTPGTSTGGYEAALKYVIDQFPADPSTYEARWLLGKLRLVGGDRQGAQALWKAIPQSAPQWLDTIAATVRLFEEDLATLRINGDIDAVGRRLDEARAFLNERAPQAKSDHEANTLRLLRGRLELTTSVGKHDLARLNAEQVLRSVAVAEQRAEARAIRMVSVALLGRFVEAEQEAMREVSTPASNPAVLLETLRLLDHAATESDSDLRARRMGFLMTTLVRPLSKNVGAYDKVTQAEIRLREIRGNLFVGADEAARRLISGWNTTGLTTQPRLLRDLADTYNRLEAFDLAADVQRMRMKQMASGSIPWLDARYNLALAYYRGGHPTDAIQLIDATAILHPELGGGELRNKYLRLRQRLGPTGQP
jgi:tetratricopeptide (TPR) repeat protein